MRSFLIFCATIALCWSKAMWAQVPSDTLPAYAPTLTQASSPKALYGSFSDTRPNDTPTLHQLLHTRTLNARSLALLATLTPHYTQAFLALLPPSAKALRAHLHTTLGEAVLSQADTAAAIAHYGQAIATQVATDTQAAHRYATLLHATGRTHEAQAFVYAHLQQAQDSHEAHTLLRSVGYPERAVYQRLMAEGKATPKHIAFYLDCLAEVEDYTTYYDVLLRHLHQLDEATILPSDHIVGPSALPIQKLATLRQQAVREGRTAAARTYTYWLGRYCYAAQRYAEAAEHFRTLNDEHARTINSYYLSYQFARADSLLATHSLPHIGYTASPLAPYIKLWLGDTATAVRLAERATSLNAMRYATDVNDNIVFPQTLFDCYAIAGRTADALHLLFTRQAYNDYTTDHSAVGNLPLLYGYMQLGHTERAEALAETIVAHAAAPYTAINWGYTYPLVLLLANAPVTAAEEWAALTSDSTAPTTNPLPLLAYLCLQQQHEAALDLLAHQTYLSPSTALSLFTTPLYRPLLNLPRAKAILQKHLPTTALHRLEALRAQ